MWTIQTLVVTQKFTGVFQFFLTIFISSQALFFFFFFLLAAKNNWLSSPEKVKSRVVSFSVYPKCTSYRTFICAKLHIEGMNIGKVTQYTNYPTHHVPQLNMFTLEQRGWISFIHSPNLHIPLWYACTGFF